MWPVNAKRKNVRVENQGIDMLKLFVKTYIKDYPWLKLAMTSVNKLCEEDVSWTVVGDTGSRGELEKVVAQASQASGNKKIVSRIVEAQEHWPEASSIVGGYLSQQWIKMNSHRVMDNSLYWNWDSDVIAIKPFSSKTFLGKSGRPIYWISQFNSIMDGADRPAHEARISLIKEIFGLNSIPQDYMRSKVPFEYMRSMPVPLYGNLLEQCSRTSEWKRSFDTLKNGDHRFSEFNIIGNAFSLLFPEAFEWRNAESQGPTWSGGYVEGGVGSGAFQEHAMISQCWSWGGIPAHIQAFVDSL